MAVVTKGQKFLNSQNYFLTSYGALKTLKYETATASSMLEVTAKVDSNTAVTKVLPDENKLELGNGKTYTYKALVLAPGLQHDYQGIEGLEELDNKSDQNGVTVHMLDHPSRIVKNHWHGHHHRSGDFIVYHPKWPHCGEGIDFYAFYYEYQLRMEKIVGTTTKDSRIVIMTPNSGLNKFPYANDFLQQECEDR